MSTVSSRQLKGLNVISYVEQLKKPRACSQCVIKIHSYYLFFKRCYLFIFREMGGEGALEREKHRCEKHRLVASHMHQTRNPGMVPDWVLDQ